MDNGTRLPDNSDREECRGTMRFTADGKFVQNIQIHGEDVQRHGTYELDDEQITFRDELGTQDGPYRLRVSTKTKTMRISMRQAGCWWAPTSTWNAITANQKSQRSRQGESAL